MSMFLRKIREVINNIKMKKAFIISKSEVKTKRAEGSPDN